MGIFGLKMVRFGKRDKGRRRRTDRFERMAEKDLFNIAVENQKAMATLLGKYCDIQVYEDDGVEAIKQRVQDIAYRRAVQEILTKRRQELKHRITDIIGRVVSDSDKPARESDKAKLTWDLKPDGQNSSPDVTHGYRTSKRQIKGRPSLLTVLEGLANVVALASQAGNQPRKGDVDSRERIYVARLGEQMVEMTERDYKNYINRQEGIKKASPYYPQRLLFLLPTEKDDELPEG